VGPALHACCDGSLFGLIHFILARRFSLQLVAQFTRTAVYRTCPHFGAMMSEVCAPPTSPLQAFPAVQLSDSEG
jgi:hypothetical protein